MNNLKNEMAPIFTRYENGFNRLVAVLEEAGNIDNATAIKVADLYIAEKIAKIDVGVGQFKLSHGAFVEADVIANAVAMVAA